MVLMGERSPEQRHDPIAHHLVHGALVSVNRFHHKFEDRIEDLSRLFWISLSEKFHGPLEISEQDRNLLALALKGGLGGEDLLSEVLGGVGGGFSELLCWRPGAE